MKRKVTFLIHISAVFCLLLTGASAQKITAVSKDAWKEFVSEEGGFKVRVPILPTRSVTKMDLPIGKSDLIQYRVLTRNIAYSVTFVDFPSVVTDREEIQLRYDGAVAKVLSGGGNRLISQKDITLGEYIGRESQIESAGTIQTYRNFIIKQRFFILATITAKNPEASLANLKNKFFESFAITKLPDAAIEAQKLPEDFGISMQDTNFHSSYLGFSINFPKIFKFFDDEQLSLLREVTTNEAEMENSRKGNLTKFSLKRTAILAGAISLFESSIILGAELPSFPNMNLDAVADEISNNQKTDKTEKVIKPMYKAEYSGQPFYCIITQGINDGVKQFLVITLRKNLILQIVYTYKTDDEIPLFEETLKSIKFENK
jgi:hypothetical protein